MLAEKYFPKGSSRYSSLSNLFKNLDGFSALNPENWFGVWTMILAGANVSVHIADRWIYWDWSTFSFLILGILVLASIWVSRYPGLLQKVDSVKSGLFILLTGFIFFCLGTIPFGFDSNIILFGLPYFFFFLVAHMTWSLSVDDKNKPVLTKKQMAPMLLTIIVLSLLCAVIGYLNDDPMISTIAAVYSPFPIVALVFPIAVRHFQRARMYSVFIPTMFISVRFPWLLFMVLPLFWILRYYHYFRNGEVKPSFKVDLPSSMDD